jgi:uncharacterized Zn finger protein
VAYGDGFDGYDGYGWRPYVSQAERRRLARRKLQQLRKAGHAASPVEISGRKIATTFWGRAWCDNLERYSDYENRLPRGRTYVRNGSVIDLQIGAGAVKALVSGSEIYEVRVKVAPVPAARWRGICGHCAGGIDSLVELLQGRFSDAVMAHLCRQGQGLFPTPGELSFSCTCPDWASMCKHVAAVLYGIGARLDDQADLLFRLRQVDERDLLARAGEGLKVSKKKPAKDRVLGGEALSEVFGVEVVTAGAEPFASIPTPSVPRMRKRAAARPKAGGQAGAGAGEKAGAGVKAAARAGAMTGRAAAGMSAAARNAVSERMKRYWDERRRQTGRHR